VIELCVEMNKRWTVICVAHGHIVYVLQVFYLLKLISLKHDIGLVGIKKIENVHCSKTNIRLKFIRLIFVSLHAPIWLVFLSQV